MIALHGSFLAVFASMSGLLQKSFHLCCHSPAAQQFWSLVGKCLDHCSESAELSGLIAI